MSDKIQVDPALLQRMVRFVKGAGTRLEAMAKDREQAKEAAPKVVDTLVKQGLLGAESKEAAVEALADSHARAMETLRRTATHVKVSADGTPPPKMGAPATEQKAAAAKGESEELQQANQNFLAALGFSR